MQIINDIKLYEPFANEELKSMKCMDGMRSMVNTDSYDKTELLASVISAE